MLWGWGCLPADDRCCLEEEDSDYAAVVRKGVAAEHIDEYATETHSGEEVVSMCMLHTQVKEAERNAEAAWARLLCEYRMQILVWESLEFDMGAGQHSDLAIMRHQGAVAGIQSKLDFAQAIRVLDSNYAIQALEASLDMADGNILLSRTFVASMQEAVQAETAVSARRALMERFRAQCDDLDVGSSKETHGTPTCGLQILNATRMAMVQAC